MAALVTPMFEDGSLDFTSLEHLLDWHVSEGTDAVVVAGTTGESPTLSTQEHRQLIEKVVDYVCGRIPVIAGTGANSTTEAIELTQFAKKVGANASLQVTPYYNNPTQQGLLAHFQAIVQAVDLPIVVYNVPGRTVADISIDTTLRLAAIPGIIGIKDATASLERGCLLISELKKNGFDNFAVFSGDDLTAAPLMLMGARGCISVTANIAPRLMHELCFSALKDDLVGTRAIQYRLLGLHKALFTESNPIPVKWALHLMGKMSPGIRLPLTPLSVNLRDELKEELMQIGLL